MMIIIKSLQIVDLFILFTSFYHLSYAFGNCIDNLSKEPSLLKRSVSEADLVIVGTLLDINRKTSPFELISPIGDQQIAYGREGRVLIRRVFKGHAYLSNRFNELSTTASIQSRIPTIILGSDVEGILQVRSATVQPYEDNGDSSRELASNSPPIGETVANVEITDEFVTYLREGLLNVHGFYSDAICNSNAERFDTKILLLKLLPGKVISRTKRFRRTFRWRLLTSPVSLNWRTIENVERATKFMRAGGLTTRAPEMSTTRWVYSPQSSRLPTSNLDLPSCDNFQCLGPGEQCSVVGGIPKCGCPVCSFADASTVVCGTDGRTYDSMCHLARQQCQSKSKSLMFKHSGSCDVPDPCLNKNCTLGAICERSLDGLTSRCICPRHCPSPGSPGAITMCGSDGLEYQSLCQLRKAACENMKDIQPKTYGKCGRLFQIISQQFGSFLFSLDPCESYHCPTKGQICIVEPSTNQPQCVCEDTCFAKPFQPVCGSNGKTYSNPCYLELEACRLSLPLVIYQSNVVSCKQTGISCFSTSCRGPGEECVVGGRNGQPNCVCPLTGWNNKVSTSYCANITDPVCGDDNENYENLCEMTRSSCIRRRKIDLKFFGKCSDENLCSSIQCKFGAFCNVFRQKIDDSQVDFPGGAEVLKMLNASPIVSCRCPLEQCSFSFSPVCGTDGKTYQNECLLKSESCQQQKNISVKHAGQCG